MKETPFSQPGAPKEIRKNGHIWNVNTPTLTVYLPAAEKAAGTGIVICPGGGYGVLAFDHEGIQIAKWLNSIGIAGFILKYRHKYYKHPVPLLDAQRAIRTVRHRAREWNVDPQRIGIMGFSAGGHLASTAGTHFDSGKSEAQDPIDHESCRPDFMILVYPVITMSDPYTHRGSRRNLLGPNPNPKLIDLLSNEKQVTARTPPTFLALSNEDRVVPAENSVNFYLALRKAQVPAEIHIYEKGKHGFGILKNRGPAARDWPKRCEEWLRGRGLLKAKQES